MVKISYKTGLLLNFLFPVLIIASAIICQLIDKKLWFELAIVSFPTVIYFSFLRKIYRKCTYEWRSLNTHYTDRLIAESVISASVSFLSLWIAGIIFAFFAGQRIYAEVKKLKTKKRNAKRNEEESKRRIEFENQQQSNKQKAKRRIEELKNEANVSWTELRVMAPFVDSFPASLILKANFSNLLTVADAKRQITFHPYDATFAAREFEKIFKGMEDGNIEEAIEQIKAIKKYSGYRGYDALYYCINDYCPSLIEFVELKA